MVEMLPLLALIVLTLSRGLLAEWKAGGPSSGLRGIR